MKKEGRTVCEREEESGEAGVFFNNFVDWIFFLDTRLKTVSR